MPLGCCLSPEILEVERILLIRFAGVGNLVMSVWICFVFSFVIKDITATVSRRIETRHGV